MPDWNLVTRAHVLAALREYDDLGSREFLRRYGFGRAKASTLWHQGKEYDPKAILGVALLHATGSVAGADELSGGKDGLSDVLTDLGFDVVVDEEALAAEKPRRTRATKPRSTATRDTTPKVCPTCHMALPASGVCDFCD
ncbi:MAG TPA: hypothetical protein VFZ64_01960 [Nocardioidaceae bacterium]